MTTPPTQTIPIIVLAGSDRQAVALPPSGAGKRALSGHKGVDVHVGRRTLIDVVVERLVACRELAPVYVAGPARLYAELGLTATLIDTNGGLAHNVRTALAAVRRDHASGPVAFMTCDVVPELETLSALLSEHRRNAPCDLFFPLIRVPHDPALLGTSAWKPRYRIVPEPGADPVDVLPGHLVVVDPDALRRELVLRLLDLGYATRNRPLGYRSRAFIRRLLGHVLVQDLRLVFTLRAPTLTWTLLVSARSAARELQKGALGREMLERVMRQVFVRAQHRKRYPERRVLMPIVDGLSMALDVDTEEEVEDLAERLDCGPGGRRAGEKRERG